MPLSVFTVLIATSRLYDISTSLHFIIPVSIICIILVLLGVYLIIRSFKKIKDIDHKVQEIKNDKVFINSNLID